ncbi:MAG TPA: Mov34/MPN/PAD-1 family protein [Solirubrobacterales bacterium]|nr:Mov34/MPN/PAD-1 family protein [Solirubrobacterales bacterium]
MRPRCWINESALAEMWAEARRWRLRETGGALLGWRDGRDAVIARVLGPGPNAKHGFFSFEPDYEWQVGQGRRIYRESSRCVAYIGDWHTHPFASPRPSWTDRKAAKQIAEDPDFRAREPLSLIVGRGWRSGNDHRTVALDSLVVYVWRNGDLEPLDLEPCDITNA